MGDIRKNLTLSAKLDDSQLRKQLEVLKKEMGKAFSVDTQSLADLKVAFKDIARELSAQLKEGIRQARNSGSGVGGTGPRVSNDEIQDAKYRAKKYRDDMRDQDRLFEREQRQKASQSDKDNRQRDKAIASEARAKQKQEQSEQRQQERLLAKEAAAKERERKKDEARYQNSLKNQVAANEKAFGSDYSKTPSDFAGAMDKFAGGTGGGEAPRGRGGLGRIGAGLAIAAAIGETYETVQGIRSTVAERNNRLSRDFEAGLGVEGISREAGRHRFSAGLFGGLAGAGAGAAAGAATLGGAGAILGSGAPVVGNLTLGALGAAVGGIGGGILGGIKGVYHGLSGQGELNTEQTRLLADAEARARSLSPMRQQLMAGGGLTGQTLTDQMMVGARQFGMSGEDTMQAMLQARDVLGNKGAAESFNQIMGNQRFLGIGAGTTANAIETLAGTGGEGRGAAANRQADVIKKGVAAGLDVSKSGKFLQTTMQFLQNTVGLGRVNTESATTGIANITAGLAGGGPVTDTTLQQAMSLSQMLTKESTSLEGLAGAGNLTGLQNIGAQAGGFDTGTLLALSKLQKNATEGDILDVLSKNTGGAQKGDLADQVKQIQAFKNSDIMGNFVGQVAPGNLGTFLTAQEMGGTTQDALARARAMQGGITPEGMQGAAAAIQGAQAEVTQAPEFQLDVAQFTRSTESAAIGLTTFTEVTTQMTAQMKKLLTDLSDAQKKFSDLSRQTGYGGIQR